MLDPNWINNNLDDITVLTADLHTAALTSIAKHVADSLRVQPDIGIMPSTVKQIEAAQAAGIPLKDIEKEVAALRVDIEKEVAAYLTYSRQYVRELFENAAVESISYDSAIYEEAGQEPLKLSPQMQRIIQTRSDTFTATLRRLTGTIATNSTKAFENILNLAYNQTVSGVESYTTALNDAMDKMFGFGIEKFTYESGTEINIAPAILMNLRTSINQTAGVISHNGMIERDVPACETSAHGGARAHPEGGYKSHIEWQGRVFSLKGKTDDLEDFYSACGYGKEYKGLGIYGYNCRHSHSPFYPNISTPRWSPEELARYEEQKYTFTDSKGNEVTMSAYDTTQYQRRLETRVRDIKTRLAVETAKGDLARPEVIIKLKRDRAQANKRIDRFCTETGLKRAYFRERVAKR